MCRRCKHGDRSLSQAGIRDVVLDVHLFRYSFRQCLTAFRKSPKSGADTLYKLGQAYEQIGDRSKAVKFYEHVTTYGSHPLAPDAREALYRLQSN